jgi:hypothetical protein
MIEREQARLRLEELGLQQAALLLDAHLEAASHGQPTYSNPNSLISTCFLCCPYPSKNKKDNQKTLTGRSPCTCFELSRQREYCGFMYRIRLCWIRNESKAADPLSAHPLRCDPFFPANNGNAAVQGQVVQGLVAVKIFKVHRRAAFWFHR